MSPSSPTSPQDPPESEVAVLGGGCFWCLEAVFERLRGVEGVVSGYCGGRLEHPDYAAVCSGGSGHAEVVRVVFDPQRLDFATLLDVFFAIHDPSTRNRQGNDIGTQYRSVIFCQSPAQREQALAAVARVDVSGVWGGRAVTEVAGAETFWLAEEGHQHYFAQNGSQPYCRAVVAPKVAKLRHRFAALVDEPAV